jgi:3-deoxy-D-manno-octulosonate 8-phosphate phosphatase (KDO 8-P phosphatase)
MKGRIEVAIITGRESKALLHRAKDLGVALVYQKVLDKIKAYDQILRDKGLTDKEVCYIGDDLVDLPILRRVGFSVAVADGIDEVKKEADYITRKEGGKGAVREVCELILKAQNRWKKVTEKYFK